MDEWDKLTHGERLLVRTARLLAIDAFCSTQRCQFEHAAGGEAYRTLEVFLGQLRLRGRRRIALSVPTDRRLTADEALVLDAFGAAQGEDYRTLDERLGGLIGASEIPSALGAAACLLAQHFAMSGLILRPRPAPGQCWAARTTPRSTAVQCAAAAATT